MTTYNEQYRKTERMKIQTDIPLWNLLLQGTKKSHKFTKAEAFYDLIDRQRIALLTDEEEYLKGSILEFSKSWGWDRETVAKFLENLQQLGAITIHMAGNRKAVHLNYSMAEPDSP